VGPLRRFVAPALPADAGRAGQWGDGCHPVVAYGHDAEELLAVPAIRLDAAFVHLNRADERGSAQFLGPDLYFDDLFLGACEPGRRFLSCERVVPTEALLDAHLGQPVSFHTLRINRSMVDGVIESPNGAHFTTCEPDYGRDEAFQKDYVAAAGDPAAWAEFVDRYLSGTEDQYQDAIRRG